MESSSEPTENIEFSQTERANWLIYDAENSEISIERRKFINKLRTVLVLNLLMEDNQNSFLKQWIEGGEKTQKVLNFSVSDLIEAIKSIQLNRGLRGLEAEQTNPVINDAIQRLLQREKEQKNANELEVNQVEPENDAGKSRPLWEKLVEIGEQVPDEEWQKLPTDFSRNLEHYLYGLPKEP